MKRQGTSISIAAIASIAIVMILILAGAAIRTGMAYGESKGDEKPLAGKVVCIDPGHQKLHSSRTESIAPGSSIRKITASTGTRGVYSKVPEYELNLAVSKLLRKKLEAKGAKVVMTRTVNNTSIGLKERAFIGNRAKADLSVRIHGDGSVDSSVNGISVLIPGARYIKDKRMIKESALAGKSLLKHAVSSTGAASRGISVRSDMTGFNWSKVPSVLIEVGFMTNRKEDMKLATSAYREKIADGICDGVVAYLGDGR